MAGPLDGATNRLLLVAKRGADEVLGSQEPRARTTQTLYREQRHDEARGRAGHSLRALSLEKPGAFLRLESRGVPPTRDGCCHGHGRTADSQMPILRTEGTRGRQLLFPMWDGSHRCPPLRELRRSPSGRRFLLRSLRRSRSKSLGAGPEALSRGKPCLCGDSRIPRYSLESSAEVGIGRGACS